jgi:PAS domain S-box-containing protein
MLDTLSFLKRVKFKTGRLFWICLCLACATPVLLLKADISHEIMRQLHVTARFAAWSTGTVQVLALVGLLIALWFSTRLNKSRQYASQIEKVVEEQTAKLRETQQFLEMAVAQSPCGILIADAPDVTIRLANDAALDIRGGNPSALTGIAMAQHVEKWQMFLPDGAPYPTERLPLYRAVIQGELTRDAELIIRDEAGNDHWISANAAPIRDANGQVTAGIAIIHDVTERKLTEEEMQKMQRLRSIGTLAGGIAHDFNNILMALYGNIALAKEALPPEHESFKPLSDAEKSMNRAIRLTRQLLTFARGGEPIKEDISIDCLVEEAVQFDLSGSNVVPVIARAKGLWKAEADKGQVHQVISNLTINAREAMPAGGRLHVGLENVEIAEGGLPGVRKGKYIKITMRDEGGGIERKHLERLFEPYFSTKHSDCGLGLATTYSIVVKHGGHIRVDSELGKGTTFTLHLPASEVPPQLPSPVPSVTEVAPAVKSARILILDDEEMLRLLVSKMLQNNGYTVETAAEGNQAVTMYKQALETGNPFDVVIMDLTIPGGVGGKEAIKALLTFHAEAKAIVSSGYAEDPVMAHHAEYGFKGVVAKPYTQQELLNVVSRVLQT